MPNGEQFARISLTIQQQGAEQMKAQTVVSVSLLKGKSIRGGEWLGDMQQLQRCWICSARWLPVALCLLP